MSRWTTDAMPAQDGRTFVVTGGSSGLGLELCRALAVAGARVVMAVRSRERGHAAADRIVRTGARGSAEVRELDLASLESVRAFARDLCGADVLVNNAGVMAPSRARTADGFELQIGTNHLGHFALANLLLPTLTDRVVVVSSRSHRDADIDVDDLNLEGRGYRPYAAYAQSKLANLLFLTELDRRLTGVGSPLRATGAHPGYTATGIQGSTGSRAFTGLSNLGNALLGMRPSQGALPVLHAATMDVPGNTYVGPSGPGELWGWPTEATRSAAATDPQLARRLWVRSEELTDVRFPL